MNDGIEANERQDAPELISIVLDLAVVQGGHMQGAGRVMLAEVLRHVARRNPQLASQLHDREGVKPFTCSGLLESDPQVEQTRIEAGKHYHVRLTGLTPDVCQAWERHFVADPPQRIEAQGCEFAVAGVCSTTSEHGWAGRATYGELLGRALARGMEANRTISLELATPLAFRTRGMNMPLPLPALLFGSLAERWNTFSPYPLPGDVRRVAEEEVAVSSFVLMSAQSMYKDGGLQIGGYGRIKYRYLGKDRQAAVALDALAEFARYSGVGIKTTAGMGQCRRSP